MDQEDERYLRHGAACPHAHLSIKYVDYLRQLEMYCPDCDNLLCYSADDLRQIMMRNLQRRVVDLDK